MEEENKRGALAAKYFPSEWRAAHEPGESKKRNQLRSAAEKKHREEELWLSGARCGNCVNFTPKGPCGSYCELDTDFKGYALTHPGKICSRWSVLKPTTF